MRSYFSVALATILLACAIIWLTVITGVPGFVSLFALLPLVAYHFYLAGWLAFLFQPREIPGDAEIDSVYYIGFLITVMELAASAVILFRDPAAGAQPILIRFSVGLIATGYAVVARLHLQSKFPASEVSSDAAWQGYGTRAAALLADLELAVLKVREFQRAVEREALSGAQRLEVSLQETAANSARMFAEELKRGSEGALASVEALHALLTDDAAKKGRDQLGQQLESAVTATDKMVRSLDRITGKADALSGTLEKVGNSSSPLVDTTTRLEDSLSRLVLAATALPGAITDIRDVSVSAKDAAAAAGGAAIGIANLVAGGANAGSAMLEFSNALGLAEHALDSFAQPLAGVRASLGEIAVHGGATANALEIINLETSQLSQHLEELKRQLGETVPSLGRDVEASAAAVLRLADGLASVADLIIERTRQKAELA